MVEAIFEREGSAWMLTMRGHATGSETVCAACSAIAYTLMGWVENSEEHAHAAAVNAESGELFVRAECDSEASAVFQAAWLGLLQIAESYPQHVTVRLLNTAYKANDD